MTNIKELLKKTFDGTISHSEIKNVYNALVKHEGDEYELLLILGRAEATQYKELVESYLNATHDPMLVKLALQILCLYWDFAIEYKETIEKYIEKVDWDEEEDVRLMAIRCVAEVFKNGGSPELLGQVYDVFKNEEEDVITRGAAYETLALVAGLSSKDLPQPLHFNLNRDVDPEIIKKVEDIVFEYRRNADSAKKGDLAKKNE